MIDLADVPAVADDIFLEIGSTGGMQIAAQLFALLHQGHIVSVVRCGDGRFHACGTAAYHEDLLHLFWCRDLFVGLQLLALHIGVRHQCREQSDRCVHI